MAAELTHLHDKRFKLIVYYQETTAEPQFKISNIAIYCISLKGKWF